MRLFHYTSIETLALILKNKTIRFTRLDKVDDPDEYGIKEDGVTPAHYCFVSCWTKNIDESIPQWYIYGNSSHGVRLELNENMFDIESDSRGYEYLANVKRTSLGDGVLPILNHKVLYDIQYVENVENIDKKIFKSMGEQKGLYLPEVGVYKSKDWEFQNECRFKLYAMPMKPFFANRVYSLPDVVANNIPPKVSYIDVPLAFNALNKMNILLGPKSTDAEKVIVGALMEKYLGRTDYQISSYTDKM